MNHQLDLWVGSRCLSVCVCVSWAPKIICGGHWWHLAVTADRSASLLVERKKWKYGQLILHPSYTDGACTFKSSGALFRKIGRNIRPQISHNIRPI